MTTSGTYSFAMSRDDIIGAAVRTCGQYGPYDVIPAQVITNYAQAFNILVKSLAKKGLPLWCVQDVSVAMVTGQQAYNLSTLTGQTLPLRILDLYLRDSTGNDVTVMMVSRYDFDMLGQKASQSVPNQAYYDPQLGNGTLYLYNVPADSTHTLHVVIQRQIQDFNLSTDNPDFPQEAFQMLKWNLADEIALEAKAPTDVRVEIAAKAKAYRDDFFDFEQEQVSVFLTPSERTR